MQRFFKKRNQTVLLGIGLVISVVVILWLTLFSRTSTGIRSFYKPFWSFLAILFGDKRVLIENLENIILFLPFGLFASVLFKLNIKETILAGLVFSLLIEISQWFSTLGFFEIDDLINNTIGTMIGALLINWKGLKNRFLILPEKQRKKYITTAKCVFLIFLLSTLGFKFLKEREMRRYAVLNNRMDGTVNLLVLNPYPDNPANFGFHVSHNKDGSITMEGKSNNRTWIEIGRIQLPPGRYSFSGFSGVQKGTIAIELEYYNRDKKDFIRLTQDVGPVPEALFELKEKTKVRALIGIYPEAEGSWNARPAIYKENN